MKTFTTYCTAYRAAEDAARKHAAARNRSFDELRKANVAEVYDDHGELDSYGYDTYTYSYIGVREIRTATVTEV